MNPPPPPPPVVAAPPAAAPAAAAGGTAAAAGNARRRAGRWWQPVVSWDKLTRAHIAIAVAAAAFALVASTIRPANFDPHCATTAAEAMELRYCAGLLLLCAMAQAGAATTALVIVPPSLAGGILAGFANLLGLATLVNLIDVVPKVLSATGVFCLTGHLNTARLTFHIILAYVFLFATHLVLIVGDSSQPLGRD